MKRKNLLSIVTLLAAAMAVIGWGVMLINTPSVEATPTQSTMTQHLTAVATMSYANWSRTGNYALLRDSTTYEWMDWSQDGCSSPPGLDLGYADDFHLGCLRHDLMWRSMAVADNGRGRVWNERNRLFADKKFEQDHLDYCAAEYSWWTAFTSRLECEAAARAYYGGIRVPHRFATTDAEDNSVDSTHADYYHGIERMGLQNCAAANNRCLPINYIKYEGKPFAAEKISALPVRVPLKMEVIRANQQSVNGAPDSSIPLIGTNSDKPTGELRVEANSPFIVSRDSDLSCTDIPTPRVAYADTDTYPVSTSDTSIKSTDIYVMSCIYTLTHQEDDPQLEIHQMKTARQSSGGYDTDPGLLRIRHYQHINMENAVAFLSPEPDDINFTQPRRWHAVTLNTVTSANLTNAVVIANPDDGDPIVEITTTSSSALVPDYCSNGADTDDDITVNRGGTFYLSMCEAGTGEVEVRHSTSDELLNRYTVSMSSGSVVATLIPTVQPTTVANTCPATTLSYRTHTLPGRWSTYDCQSDYRPAGRYADYYLIRPRANATVTIDLESTIDPYLVLYANGTTDAHHVAHNDDKPSGGLNSQLTYDMQVGTNYYIEATTYGRYRTGSYRLRLTLP